MNELTVNELIERLQNLHPKERELPVRTQNNSGIGGLAVYRNCIVLLFAQLIK